jgi:hypothetical protein
MIKITPFSQLVSIVFFIVFALLSESFTTIIVQLIFISISFALLKGKLSDIFSKDYFRLIPILMFIIVLNAFRGGGEIILKAGPFVLLKQGIFRGLYYAAVVIVLFMMSRLITNGFSPDLLISTFYTIDRHVFYKFRFKREKPEPDKHSFFIVLYYVLKIFKVVYSELKLFFKSGKGSLKEKTVLFFNTVFKKSLDEYEQFNKVSVLTIRPVFFDYLFVAGQVSCLSSAIIFKSWMI